MSNTPNLYPAGQLPETLSTHEIGGLMAGVGNHESKAIVLASMKPGEFYGITALHGLYLRAQGSDPVHVGSTNNQRDYCESSFEPNGLVDTDVSSGFLRYGISDYGFRYGKALAGYLLDFSSRHPESLSTILGVSGGKDPDVRPPERRLKIINKLLEVGLPINLSTLSVASGENVNTLGLHLRNMCRSGLVKFESQDLEEYRPTYRPTSDRVDLTVMGSQKTFSLESTKIINRMIEVGLEVCTTSVVAELAKIHRYAGWSEVSLRNVTSKYLNFLVRSGQMERYRDMSKDSRSVVQIREDKRDMLAELVQIISRIGAGNEQYLSEGRRKANEIVSDPETAKKLIKKVSNGSKLINRNNRREMTNYISKILEASDLLATEEVARSLGEAGFRAGFAGLGLRLLAKDGIVIKKQVGVHALWSLLKSE